MLSPSPFYSYPRRESSFQHCTLLDSRSACRDTGSKDLSLVFLKTNHNTVSLARSLANLLRHVNMTFSFPYLWNARCSWPSFHHHPQSAPMYASPTIEANQPDRLILPVQNNLPNGSAFPCLILCSFKTAPTTTMVRHPAHASYSGIAFVPSLPRCMLIVIHVLDCPSCALPFYIHITRQYTDGITGALIVHSHSTASPNLGTGSPPALRLV